MPHLFPIDRYLNVRAATSPSFSPDGQHVAYLSNTTGIPQAWLIPTFGGEPVQLTFGPDANGENVVAYTLRHTAATRACTSGVPDRVLADLMGHTSTDTTRRYQHPRLDDLARAIRQANTRKAQ